MEITKERLLKNRACLPFMCDAYVRGFSDAIEEMHSIFYLALCEISRREQEQTAMAEWEAEDRVRFPAWWECEDARRRAEQAKGGVGDE